ncbi:sensor histidine kinase [Massilia endophytica]|uniref:sensor histidine kinase n=1 Tax=Massilia endophytica TaxID=2899220 RepID=UPI001E35E64F|nr:HAMP domain-containing sensor histidine kinase [Massilia endophytica]UGQ47252.1 HAMP domain-containing histidine kinase [Massilia endophytica]
MQIGTDQDVPDRHLTPAARRLLGMSDAIIGEWSERVRREVEGMADMAHPILINTMPVFLQNLVEAISPGHPRNLASSNSSIAMAHGSERARMTDYRPQDIAHEYQLFRDSLFDVSERLGLALDREQRALINGSIDSAVLESISAYSAAQAAFRTNYIATLAHDLRTPLSVIMSAISMLDADADAARIAMLAAAMRKNLDRADQMLREMLDTAALHSSEYLPIQPGDLELMDLVHDVVRDAPLHSGGYLILGEEARGFWCGQSLRRALENLIRNAVKYGQRDTPITVAVQPRDEQVTLSVHNMGKPIPPDQIAEHFLMFRRGSQCAKVHGWGLGLAFVKNVAESHGGSINIDSSAENGTTVSLELPRQAIPAASERRAKWQRASQH